MIVRTTLDWRIVWRIARKRASFLVLFSTAVVLAHDYLDHAKIEIPSLPASILGIALSILIGFRVNSAYERWWEARRLWGALLNDTRSIARQTSAFAFGENLQEKRRELLYGQIGFLYALKRHLRRQNPMEELDPFFDASTLAFLSTQKHIPNAILALQARRIHGLHREGHLDGFEHMLMDARLTALTDSMGGCERIKNTVFPRQYSVYASVFIEIYSYMLPLIIVHDAGWLTVPVVLLIGFIFFALNSIAGGIENPFENSYNDTPMNAVSRTAEINLREMLGETELPEPEQAIRGFLY